MKQKKRAYLAGKVTGRSIRDITFQFGAAQMWLEARGYEVVNPLAVVNDWHCPWPKAMKKCIIEMLICDVVFMLPGWEESRGAKLEHHIAKEIGLEIIDLKI